MNTNKLLVAAEEADVAKVVVIDAVPDALKKAYLILFIW